MTPRELIEKELVVFALNFPDNSDVRFAAQRIIDLAKGIEPTERCFCAYGPEPERKIILCDVHERKDQKSA